MTLLSMTRGDTASFSLTLTDAGGDPLNLTDVPITFTAKRRLADADSDAVLRKSVGDGIVVDAPLTGMAILTIDPIDTSSLEDLRTLLWDVQVEDAGEVHTPLRGKLAIARDVTRQVEGS